MRREDPFKGIPLSQQAGKLDQRLFGPDPGSSQTPAQPPPDQSKSSSDVPKALPEPKTTPQPKTDGQAHLNSAKSTRTTTFDINDEPLYKASFVFTQPELEALEDLKLELRRDLDQKVTKNDLIRSALHMLLEDHRSDGKKSYARRKVRRRSE